MAVTNSWTLPPPPTAAPPPPPPAPTGGPPSWATVAEIVSDAAIEEGLSPVTIDDPYASSDPNILQLLGLLKRAGRGLVRERGWTHLQREFTFSTVVGQASYPLPSDFREMIPQSGWDRSTMYQLGGPVGAAVWQLAKAITITGSLRPLARFNGGNIEFTPTPTKVETIAFEYVSSSWVKPAGEPSPSKDAPSAATDVICFNSDLVVCALKLAWEKAKRMDTTAAQADYDRALASEMNADASSPDVSLGGSDKSPAEEVWNNVPQSGIGQ